MTTSVVLCCYNGEKYIAQLLESLAGQSKKPDEVLIFDDRSQDQTVAIVQTFITEHGLKNWTVTVNEQNKGWKQNFIEGLQKARGDIVLPCDQDDIWHADKISLMSRAFETKKQIQVLVSNYHIQYQEEGHQKIDKVFSRNVNNEEGLEPVPANEKGVYILRPGCVMAIRREFIAFALQYSFTDYPHDALFWRTAVYSNSLFLLQKELITFRRHTGNASDKPDHSYQGKLNQINYYIEVIRQLQQMCRDQRLTENEQILDKVLSFWTRRQQYYENGGLLRWLRMALRDQRYYLTKKAMLGDLYIVSFNKKRGNV